MASTTAMDVLEELSSDSSENQVQPRKPEKAKRKKDRPKKEGPEKKAKKEKQEKAKPEKKPKKKPEKEKQKGEKLETKPKKDKREKAKPKKKPEQEKPEQEKPEQETPEQETPEQEKPEVQCRRRSLHQSIREDERRARLIRRRKNSFAIYFPKVLKNIHVGLSLSQRSVNILDSFVKDMFERIASEASFLVRQARNSTINSREIQTAIRLLLPGELCRRAVAEGTMAMVRYISNK
ncbi:histone H2B type 3-A-like [Mus caroli]|uniref:Histone H2B type 3-A-like n=1 Tax=Mus caroli TaxID=10089 RepID=A0A6P5NY25_MUSCR|nr:histone H2B type 3-A-like [Mus caroli]